MIIGNISLFHLLLLTFVATVAGIVDTLAGGGGLITVPALLLSGVPPVLALGTNKLQSCLCESSASIMFYRKNNLNLKQLKTGLLFTLLGSIAGTLLLQVTQVELLKKLVPFFLLSVFIMNLLSKNKEEIQKEQPTSLFHRLIPLGIGIGFYNGFFGPGTGTIWAISLRKFLKASLKSATMMTKPLNLVGNLTALGIFLASGHIHIWTGLAMGLGAIGGGIIGANLVMFKNAKWLKITFNILMATSVVGAFFAK